jgi:hypothetical protein
MTFDCHWKSMKGCVGTNYLLFCSDYNAPTLLLIRKIDRWCVASVILFTLRVLVRFLMAPTHRTVHLVPCLQIPYGWDGGCFVILLKVWPWIIVGKVKSITLATHQRSIFRIRRLSTIFFSPMIHSEEFMTLKSMPIHLSVEFCFYLSSIRVPNSPFDFDKYDHHQVACSVCMKTRRVSTIVILHMEDKVLLHYIWQGAVTSFQLR